MDHVVGAFLEHGLLGVVALMAIIFAIKKDREVTNVVAEKDALHAVHAERLQEIAAENKAEMLSLEERYITKSETWMEKYYDLAVSQSDTLASLERRWGKE